MENEKVIKLTLDYFDENGKRSTKETTIKVNTPKLRDKSSNFLGYHKAIYQLTFSLKLPDHIHSYLIGKSVPCDHDRDATRVYSEKFPKTINCDSIELLTNKYWEIISDYKWLKDIDSAELTKVIFYKFESENKTYRSSWNGNTFGKINNLSFRFAIGYTSNTNNKELRYTEQKLLISEYHDREFYNYMKFIKWTEERELFFRNIQDSFEQLSKNIKSFEENLTENNINNIIESRIMLLSNNSNLDKNNKS